MSERLDQDLLDLARAPRRRRATVARALIARNPEWSQLRDAFNALHAATPALERIAAAALGSAARRAGDAHLAARLALFEARAIHRVGAPDKAARAFARAATLLDAEGDTALATKALVLRVDALAHAGSVEDALDAAEHAATRIRGPDAPTWRSVLAINRGNALRLAGRVSEAAASFDGATRSLRRRGETHTAAIAQVNAGVAMLEAGDAVRARSRFAGAADAFEQAGVQDMARDARHNEAWAALRCGELGPSLAALQTLADEHEQAGHVRREAVCRMDIAEALHRAGDHVEAERVAVAAAAAFARSGAPAERADALLLAADAAERGRAEAGEGHRRQALAAAEAAGRPGLALRCRLLAFDAASRAGTPPDMRTLAALARRARSFGQEALAAEVDLLRVREHLDQGRLAAASRLLAQPGMARPGRPWLRAAAETARAALDANAGKGSAAIRRLRRVARFLDTVRGDLPGSWLRTTFVLDRLDPYLQLVTLLLERGRAADRREAEALLDALAARRFLERTRPAQALAPDDLRQRLEAIYDQLARGDGPTRGLDPARTAVLQREAAALERALASSRREHERRGGASRHVEVVGAPAARLRRDTALVHVWPRGDRLHALVRIGRQVGALAELGSAGEVRSALERISFHADRLRCFGDGTNPAPLLASLVDLSDRLLGPLRPEALPKRVRFVVDPDCPPVPWALLPWQGRPLGASRSVATIPSARVRPRRRRPGSREVVMALGEADLPHVRRELDSIGSGAVRIEGPRATRSALQGALVDSRAVHLAGHGFAALEAPYMGGVRLADGWFSAVDVPSRIGAELVVLAACRAGHATGRLAAAWGGLPTALLAAGARWVLWTTADVDDSTTADLMARFHAERRHAPPDEAFGAALDAVWQARGHPAHLLPFRLSGISA